MTSPVETLIDDPYQVELERFHGPLELLLHLIRKQDIDIFDIPISRITEQFLGALRRAERLQLERAGEFLELAAILVRIKVQMLFPRRADEDEDDPRADLVRRLLEYEHFSEVAGVLARAEQERLRQHPRGFVPVRPAPLVAAMPLETGWHEVWQAATRLVERLAEPEPGVRITSRPVRMQDKMELILERLRASARVEFAALVRPWGTRMHAVMSLLACLELARRDALRIRQTAPFAPLWLVRARPAER